MRVERLWRYPVKSMRGGPADAIDVTRTGTVGDRRYAIRDASRRLGSGKNTARLRKIDGLFRFHAAHAGGRTLITLPDGRCLAADDPAIDEVLSTVLGQPLTLERADDGSHFDDSPVHLLTTASLAWLWRTLPEVPSDERRFRPNIVLGVAGDEPFEQDWLGRTLRLGAQLELRLIQPTRRCGMVAFAQDELPHDPRVLRHITRHADLLFGVYAEVLQPGRVAVGDGVTFLA